MHAVKISVVFFLISLSLFENVIAEEDSLGRNGRRDSYYALSSYKRDGFIDIYLKYISTKDEVAYILSGRVSSEINGDVLQVDFEPLNSRNSIRLLWPKKNDDNMVTVNTVISFKVSYPEEHDIEIKFIELTFTEVEVPIARGMKTKKINLRCNLK